MNGANTEYPGEPDGLDVTFTDDRVMFDTSKRGDETSTLDRRTVARLVEDLSRWAASAPPPAPAALREGDEVVMVNRDDFAVGEVGHVAGWTPGGCMAVRFYHDGFNAYPLPRDVRRTAPGPIEPGDTVVGRAGTEHAGRIGKVAEPDAVRVTPSVDVLWHGVPGRWIVDRADLVRVAPEDDDR